MYRQTRAGVHTSAESVCQRSRLVQLISQEAAVRRAAERRSHLLETGSDSTQSFLSALALSLLPLPQGQLIHGTSPTIHDVIARPLVLRQKGRALRDEKDKSLKIFSYSVKVPPSATFPPPVLPPSYSFILRMFSIKFNKIKLIKIFFCECSSSVKVPKQFYKRHNYFINDMKETTVFIL